MHPSPTPAAEPAWRPLRPHDPARLGSYQLLGRLGSGGMGVVYAARAQPGGGLVAVKVLRAGLTDREELRRRFRREVEAAHSVAPFCTAAVLDADLDGPVQYIVSEYVAGPTLDRLVRRRGPLPPSGLHALAVGMASALAAIHAAGVVHRDLKPGNVLLAPTGPRVIDFGTAHLDDAGPPTGTGGATGTPAYMAPELQHGQEATPAADVFAWGATVAFAGTGRRAFGDGPDAAIAYRIVWDQPDLDGLDPGLRPLVQWALAKDPARRPSARDLLLGLTSGATDPGEAAGEVLARQWRPVGDAASSVMGAEPVPTPPPTVDRRDWSSQRRRRALALVGGILAGALTLGVAGFGAVALVDSLRDDTGTAATGEGAGLPGARLLLRDDFARKGNGWRETAPGEDGWSSRYVDGGYEMTAGNGGGLFGEANFFETDGVRIEVDVRFRDGGNERGGVVVECPMVAPGDPAEVEAEKAGRDRPEKVGVVLRRDGSWTIASDPRGLDDPAIRQPRTFASGRWDGFRADRVNRLAVTCLPGRNGASGGQAGVAAFLNDRDQASYDGDGLDGIGTAVISSFNVSAPGSGPSVTPTIVLIDNVEIWGRGG